MTMHKGTIYMMFVCEVLFHERMELQRFPLDRQFLNMDFNGWVKEPGHNWNWILDCPEWVPKEFNKTFAVRMTFSNILLLYFVFCFLFFLLVFSRHNSFFFVFCFIVHILVETKVFFVQPKQQKTKKKQNKTHINYTGHRLRNMNH